MTGRRLTRPADLIKAWDGIASEIEGELRRVGQRSNASRAVSVNVTLGPTDDILLVDASAGDVTIALPPASVLRGRTFTVKKIDASANDVTIEPDGSETIDGAANESVSSQWDSTTFNSNGSAWFIL